MKRRLCLRVCRLQTRKLHTFDESLGYDPGGCAQHVLVILQAGVKDYNQFQPITHIGRWYTGICYISWKLCEIDWKNRRAWGDLRMASRKTPAVWRAHFHHFPTAQYLFVNFPFLRSGISPRLDPSRETEVWPCWSLAEAMICCHQIMNASWPMVRWWRCRKHREVKHHGFSLDFDHPGRTFPVKTAWNQVWDDTIFIAFFGGAQMTSHHFGIRSMMERIQSRGISVGNWYPTYPLRLHLFIGDSSFSLDSLIYRFIDSWLRSWDETPRPDISLLQFWRDRLGNLDFPDLQRDPNNFTIPSISWFSDFSTAKILHINLGPGFYRRRNNYMSPGQWVVWLGAASLDGCPI